MIKYIISDLLQTVRFLPYGIAAGLLTACALKAVNVIRIRRQKHPVDVPALTGFFSYVAVILCITYLSREYGSRTGIDMELFSTWGINARNNAYVIENVLLFIPYGYVLAWAFLSCRKLPCCLMAGMASSMLVECMQLVTGRGYFQIDDVLTNTLGAVIGWAVFRIFHIRRRGGKGKGDIS